MKSIPSSSGVEPVALPVHNKAELESAVADFAREPKGGFVALPDSFMVANRVEVIALAARSHLALVAPYRFYPELGGLLSYGVDIVDNYRRSASYVDRILKGAKPSELPVQAPVKFELVINRKTAKALGLTVPPKLLAPPTR